MVYVAEDLSYLGAIDTYAVFDFISDAAKVAPKYTMVKADHYCDNRGAVLAEVKERLQASETRSSARMHSWPTWRTSRRTATSSSAG